MYTCTVQPYTILLQPGVPSTTHPHNPPLQQHRVVPIVKIFSRWHQVIIKDADNFISQDSILMIVVGCLILILFVATMFVATSGSQCGNLCPPPYKYTLLCRLPLKAPSHRIAGRPGRAGRSAFKVCTGYVVFGECPVASKVYTQWHIRPFEGSKPTPEPEL